MRNMNPKLLPNYEVEVIVENNMVEQYMRSKQIDLMNYLRTNLRNDYIILRFTQAQEDGQQRTFSRLEQFNELLSRSAALAMLKKELSLELA